MSEPKFTPGVLLVVEGLRPVGAEASIWYEDGDLAAEVHGNLGALPDPIDATALATLFAAAPEMYEALKEVETIVEMSVAEDAPSLKKLRAALSKAVKP